MFTRLSYLLGALIFCIGLTQALAAPSARWIELHPTGTPPGPESDLYLPKPIFYGNRSPG